MRDVAFLFDFDGTLWDCEPLVFQAYDEYFRGFGRRLPQDRWCALMGGLDPDPWGYLEEVTGAPVDRSAARAAVDVRKRELLAGAGLRQGVRTFLADVDARGIRRGIVSNSTRAWIAEYTRQGEIEAGWEVVECADGDAARAKPSPALYQAAVARMGVDVDRVVAFEDSTRGVRAAKSAGIRCVAVAGPLTAGVEFEDADLRIDCFTRIGVAAALDLAGCRA